jgi:lipoate---protein ligase
MKFLYQTLPTLAENLALDEALLESADQGQTSDEVLRVWQAESAFIVVGRSSKVDTEVNRAAAAALNAPIFRRVSGGTSVAANTGCMFYAVLLDLEKRPHLRMLDEAHGLVMSKLIRAIQPLRSDISLQGSCDLVVSNAGAEKDGAKAMKVSGNSLRVGRRWMLYHGTLLIDMELSLIAQVLNHPPREPEYRQGRPHAGFLANLHVDSDAVRESLASVWNADGALESLPTTIVHRLVKERYSQASWNYQR